MTLNNRTFTLLKIVLLIIISIFIAEIIVLPKIEHDMLQEAGRQELVTVQQICGAVLENYPDVEQDFILGLRQPTNSLQEKGEQILKQYGCSRNRMVRGKHCEYKAMLKKTDIEPMVIEAIREIVRNEEYAQAIKKRIGVQIDTKAVDKELEGYQAKLKEVDLNKTRLEREIDSLPADAKYRERKLHDMTLRLDSLYDVIVELEEKIEDARLRRDAIKQQAITLENIYKIMVNFDCVYNIINDEEKRNVVTALIKEIEIYRNDESEYPLKRIGLNFPVFKDGGEVTELLWDKGNTVECVLQMTRKSN